MTERRPWNVAHTEGTALSAPGDPRPLAASQPGQWACSRPTTSLRKLLADLRSRSQILSLDHEPWVV